MPHGGQHQHGERETINGTAQIFIQAPFTFENGRSTSRTGWIEFSTYIAHMPDLAREFGLTSDPTKSPADVVADASDRGIDVGVEGRTAASPGPKPDWWDDAIPWPPLVPGFENLFDVDRYLAVAREFRPGDQQALTDPEIRTINGVTFARIGPNQWQVLRDESPAARSFVGGPVTITDPAGREWSQSFEGGEWSLLPERRPDQLNEPRFTPDGLWVQRSVDGAWEQVPQSLDQPKIFTDPVTGERFFLSSQNGAWQRIPANRPQNIEQLITNALADGDFDQAQAFFEFSQQPTKLELLDRALAIARDPVDFYTLGQLARGQLRGQDPSTLPRGTDRVNAFLKELGFDFDAPGPLQPSPTDPAPEDPADPPPQVPPLVEIEDPPVQDPVQEPETPTDVIFDQPRTDPAEVDTGESGVTLTDPGADDFGTVDDQGNTVTEDDDAGGDVPVIEANEAAEKAIQEAIAQVPQVSPGAGFAPPQVTIPTQPQQPQPVDFTQLPPGAPQAPAPVTAPPVQVGAPLETPAPQPVAALPPGASQTPAPVQGVAPQPVVIPQLPGAGSTVAPTQGVPQPVVLTPGQTGQVGGITVSMDPIPEEEPLPPPFPLFFRHGGVVPGAPGTHVNAVLEAGEVVLPTGPTGVAERVDPGFTDQQSAGKAIADISGQLFLGQVSMASALRLYIQAFEFLGSPNPAEGAQQLLDNVFKRIPSHIQQRLQPPGFTGTPGGGFTGGIQPTPTPQPISPTPISPATGGFAPPTPIAQPISGVLPSPGISPPVRDLPPQKPFAGPPTEVNPFFNPNNFGTVPIAPGPSIGFNDSRFPTQPIPPGTPAPQPIAPGFQGPEFGTGRPPGGDPIRPGERDLFLGPGEKQALFGTTPIGRPRALAPQFGLNIPSAQELRRLAPFERESLFGEAERRGLRREEFEFDIARATPGSPRPSRRFARRAAGGRGLAR